MIKLNLCGTLFEVDKKILCKSEYFLNMFADCNDDNNIININRPPHIFKHVLSYLIDDNYSYPQKYESELKFFLISYDKLKLYDPNAKIIYKINVLENKIKHISEYCSNINEKLGDMQHDNSTTDNKMSECCIKNFSYDIVQINKNCKSCNEYCSTLDKCQKFYCNNYAKPGKKYCDIYNCAN